MDNPTCVVNLRHEPYDVYIGCAGHGQDGYFGNPFPLTREADRPAVIEKYRQYFSDRLVRTQSSSAGSRRCAESGSAASAHRSPATAT